MIIKNLSYEAIFQKIEKDFILNYVIGIAFNDDRTVSVILSDDIFWKVIRDPTGGVHLFSGDHMGSKWKEECYIESGDFCELIF